MAQNKELVRLIGVYDADHTIRGELAYWIGARFGRRHCGLCDVTHGLFRPRGEWVQCQSNLGVPFDTYHRDDQPAAMAGAANGIAPIVGAQTSAGFEVLLGPAVIDRCDGSIPALFDAVAIELDARGITGHPVIVGWPNEAQGSNPA